MAQVKKKVKSKSKKLIYSLVVALISVFFIAHAIQMIYPSPQWNEYCPESLRPTTEVVTEAQCLEIGGVWTNWTEKTPQGAEGWCDTYSKCQKLFEDARKPYERNVFIINLVLGLGILLSTFFISVESISLGLMGGGALLMIYGTMRYWSELSDVLRTFFLGVALAVLVYFGYKKLR